MTDPFGDSGTDQIEREWRLLSSQIASSDEAVRDLQRFYSPWDTSWDPSLEEARAALIGEMTSWVDYVFREQCHEHEFHNGMRDRGRPAGTTLRVYISMTGRSNFSATSVSLTYYDSNPMLPGGGVTQVKATTDRSLWGTPQSRPKRRPWRHCRTL